MGINGCKSLGEFVQINDYIKILRLQWNKIHSEGASFLFDAVANNTSLKNLDVSWNMLGTKELKKNEKVITSMAAMVNSGTLAHLDISYNSLKQKECTMFGDLIRDNTSLFGLHMQGNACMVDTYGVVRTDKRYDIQNYGKDNLIGYHSIDGKSVHIKDKKLKIAKIKSHTHCWI